MDDGIHSSPTKANIMAGIVWLVEGAHAGDSLFMHYRHHPIEIEVIQNKFCRAVLGTRVLVAAVAARADLGLSSLKSHRQVIKLGYWAKLCCADPGKLL
jgi:hypothetical protein